MATDNSIRILDKPRWRPVTPQISGSGVPSAGTAGAAFTCDIRGRGYADPNLWVQPLTSTVLQTYNTVTDGWSNLGISSVGGTIGSGMSFKFAPSQGPSGTIASGATTTSFTLTTALPAAVEKNQLAARGDSKGYIIRIVDNASGASGKIEERRIVGNTAGTTPTIYLDEPLSFTPTTGSRYEFLSGALYFMTTGASKAWVRIDIATLAVTTLSTTNLIATVGTAYGDLVVLDEQHVSYNRFPGEGFVVDSSTVYDNTANWVKKCLTATATAAGSITGQATGGDASVAANQFRNFQIRIVEDTTTPTAVGQRRRITTHTAGASPVYTLASNWTVTPSNTCKFVIENDNDKVLFFTNSTTVYNYNIGANTWDTTTWGARPSTPGTGLGTWQAFGLVDENNVATPAEIFCLRCAGPNGNPVDVLNIAGGATGSWSTFSMTPNYTTAMTPSSNGFSCQYDPIGGEGAYMYFGGSFGANQSPYPIYRLNLRNRNLSGFVHVPTVIGSSTDSVTQKMGLGVLWDNSKHTTFLYLRIPNSGSGIMFECAILK